jgi:hypothetical protein
MPTALTFTTDNWDTPQQITVTPLTDDDTVDNTLTLTLTSDGLSDRKVSVTVADRDVQSIVVSTPAVSVLEGDAQNVGVSLAHDPLTPLTVTLVSANPAVAIANPASLTFTSGNYQTPQLINVRGTQDPNTVDDQTMIVLTAKGVTPQTLKVTTIDRDVQAVILSAPSATVTRNGTAPVTAKLAFAPVGSLTVNVTSSDSSILGVTPTTLTFTARTFDVAQTVTLSGLGGGTSDAKAEARFSAKGVTTKTLPVTVIDPAQLSFRLSTTTIQTTETSAPSTFTVALSQAPPADVAVTVSSSNAGVATASPSTLTFTAENFGTPQTVTVTPVHDANTVTDVASIKLLATGITGQGVSVTVTNVDRQAIVALPQALTVEEGGTSNFAVKLAFDPIDTVTVLLVSSDTTAVTVAPDSLTFTSANYSTPQSITVTGVVDANTVSEVVPVSLSLARLANTTVTVTQHDTTNPATCDQPGPLPNPPDGHHNDGLTCMSCHNVPRGPFQPFTIAGTLYADPFGQAPMSQATIHLIDANHNDIKLITAQNGNFFTDQPIAFPVRPRASKCPSIDQEMPDDVNASGGNCNGCHAVGTNAGAMNLP